jgi:hypothetical protein
MKMLQAGRMSAVRRKPNRGKSALHRAGRRVTPGTASLREVVEGATENNSLARGDGAKVV